MILQQELLYNNIQWSNLLFKDDIKQDCEVQMNTVVNCIVFLHYNEVIQEYSAMLI